MEINLIMPMGGAGTRFLNNGFECPKPLIDMQGQPFFMRACDSVRGKIRLGSLTFAVLKEHVDRFGIKKRILEAYPEAKVVVLDHVLNGAVLTAMEAAKTIDNDSPLMFVDCDLMFRSAGLYSYYANDSCSGDGTLLTFSSSLDRYSYVRTSDDGLALETAEKKVISSRAITGAYGFSGRQMFLDAAERYMSECTYNEYFMSGIYNLLIKDGKRIFTFGCDEMLSFGTPDEYERAVKADLRCFE